MPTPVSTARQCLTEEAARALDDAVAVAKRRNHAQTTSLHVLSALFALPKSILREACSLSRRNAYSPHLQFRALELSIGVSLDRLPSRQEAPDEPLVSNSLMAAIKRSQANQRRHQDTFHLYQQLNSQNSCQSSISTVKVELKLFVLSILDDPLVNRVFGDSGYLSTDIKLAILNPHESVKLTLFSGGQNVPVIDGGNLGNIAEYSPAERQRLKAYAEVLRSYEELRHRSERLEEAKSIIWSYTPGSWIEEVAGMKMSDYDIPKTTTLLLVGPKGAGKSSLVNRISRVLECDEFVSDRAQVSYDKSTGDGTYFLQEYLIPRVSGSFCLYDTRSLSDDSSENQKMLEHWMMNGVRHGELVKRESDSSSLQEQLKFKAQNSMCNPNHVRKINFVIFVVNGLSVLEAMDGDDDTKKSYTDMIAATFNNPLLSFKDDKPVVVVTHGDLLSLCDRARVRVHLGKLLDVPPTRQIFDIPESNDSAVALTIVDMLIHSLEHAERNLSGKDRGRNKVSEAERCSARRNRPRDYSIIFLTEVLKRLLILSLFLLLVVFLVLYPIPYLNECNCHSHSHSSEIHSDKTTGSIPNKVIDTGGAYFRSHSSEIQFEEATRSIPNKRNETGESEIHLDEATNGWTYKGRKETENADFQPHASREIHLDEATESISNKMKETRKADFQTHSSKIHLDEATGSSHRKIKEIIRNIRKETRASDIGLN